MKPTSTRQAANDNVELSIPLAGILKEFVTNLEIAVPNARTIVCSLIGKGIDDLHYSKDRDTPPQLLKTYSWSNHALNQEVSSPFWIGFDAKQNVLIRYNLDDTATLQVHCLGNHLFYNKEQVIALFRLFDSAYHWASNSLQNTDSMLQTANQKLQKALEESENRKSELKQQKDYLDGMIECMQDGFVVIGPTGDHMTINDAFCKMTGFSVEELIGIKPPHVPYWPPEEMG